MSDDRRKIITCRTPMERVSPDEAGGKAYNLFRLRGSGFPVPDWFVVSTRVFDALMADRAAAIESILRELKPDSADSYAAVSGRIGALILSADPGPELGALLDRHVSETLDSGPFYSVRSSVRGEDSAQNSFAGQMDSFLCVRREDLLETLKKVWASTWSARSLAYRNTRNLSLCGVSAAVIIQNMLEPRASGVLFTREPISLDRRCHISAAYGLGEGVVSDRVVTDTYRWDWGSAEIEKEVPEKDLVVVPDRSGGTATEALPDHKRRSQVLADDLVRELCNTGIRIEEAFGCPQDIEWACDRHGKVHILQARPITSPPPARKGKHTRIWDNSNIVESYPGLTLPLTFSFIRRGYEVSFARTIQSLMANRKPLEGGQAVFRNMLGLIDGHVYYNLLNWYRMLSYLPGFSRHRKSWDQMIGIQEEVDFPGTRLSAVNRIHSSLKIAHLLLSVGGCGRRFFSRFTPAYERLADRDLGNASEEDLSLLFDEISREFGGMWHLTLYNDFAAMKYYDWLKKLTGKWGSPDRPNHHNDLLCGARGLESIEPLRALIRLARKVGSRKRFRKLFAWEDDLGVWRMIEDDASYRELKSSFESYLAKYGDRAMEDLKLEIPGYREQPEKLVGLVRRYVRTGLSIQEMEARESGIRQSAERLMRDQLKNPFKRLAYSFVLRQARLAIANRENMRFARSRLYGIVRQIFLKMGRLFEEKGLLRSSD
ncbi:MAG: hypothetical protein JSV70_02650 [bacterium]|nr:MAG: hypothetical protein JSV70_02650 [bacterium]